MKTRSLRLLAAPLVLGVTASLMAAGPAGAATDPEGYRSSTTTGSSAGTAPAAQPLERRKKKGKVVWDSTVITVGTAPIAAHGRVPGGKKKVKLQVKVPGSWRTFAKTRSNKRGKFAIAGKLDWYGTHKVRVATTGRKSFKRATTAIVYSSYAPRGDVNQHSFFPGDGSTRYSFDPCKVVRYAVNADDTGPTGILLAQLGMAQISWATGIKVKYVGTSSQLVFQAQNASYKLPQNQDLLIGWGTEAEIPQFAQRNAIGLGGPLQGRLARTGKGAKVYETPQAAVMLDTDAYNDTNTYVQGYAGSKPTWGEVMLHEMGHAFGLDHVSAPDQIMYPSAGAGPYPGGTFLGLYDAGDLTGLAASGLNQGCLKPARGRDAARTVVPTPQS